MSKHHTHTQKRTGSAGYASCYETHKPLPIGEFLIYGGSCARPMVSNADIYVGFDHSMVETGKRFPWNDGEEVFFHIPDMGIPPNAEEFKKLIAWLAVQLTALKLVHIGCIGGHGRTGTVLAALVTHMTGELDSITYVRKHYCEKAVETHAQVQFLKTHYGILEVKGHKEYEGANHGGYHGATDWYSSQRRQGTQKSLARDSTPEPKSLPKGVLTASATTNPLSVWGDSIKFVKPKKHDTINHVQEGV